MSKTRDEGVKAARVIWMQLGSMSDVSLDVSRVIDEHSSIRKGATAEYLAGVASELRRLGGGRP